MGRTLQWSPTHSGRETALAGMTGQMPSGGFNGALPIQVGKLEAYSVDVLTWGERFNGALPIQVGKLETLEAWRKRRDDASMEPYPFR